MRGLDRKQYLFEKATNWLYEKSGKTFTLIFVKRNGHSKNVGVLYKVLREGRSSVWFLVDLKNSWEILNIRRICNY